MIRSLVWIFLCCQMANAFYHSPTSSPFGIRTALRVSANDRFDMEELRQRIQEEASPKLFPTPTTEFWKPPETAHVILFHPGTEQQGAHTIEFPKGSGNNVMLAFESSAACHKFAQLLKQQHFLEPTPREFTLENLTTICDTLGVFVQVVPEGVELIPPSQNVKTFGHNPTLRDSKKDLDYLLEMNESELEEIGLLEESLEYHPPGAAGAWE